MAPSSEASPRSTPTSGTGDKTFVTPDDSASSQVKDKAAFLNAYVKDPSQNDVLCGRGGSINSHPGNERFRNLVEKRKRVYLTARFKREKRLIASSIVSEIRELDPPGRFLSRDSKTGLWKDIGDEKARDKTSQALRENAPSIRAEIETEINEQRAEMQREEEEAARVSAQHVHPPQPTYYNPGWGYHSYYGYSHHAPPPPPPPHHAHPPPPPHPGAPPPPTHHAHHPHATHPGYPPYESQWGNPPPPPYGAPGYYHSPHPDTQKSAFQQTAEFVSSGAETIKSWTRSGFREIEKAASHDGVDNRSAGSVNSKPIVYVHEDEHRKRRIVKFRDDEEYKRRRASRQHCYSPAQSNTSLMGTNSLMDGIEDIEPENIDNPDDQNSSLMKQVANHILGSINSWDAAAIVCGTDQADEKVPPPWKDGDSKPAARAPQRSDVEVEWEGQEVQLLDRKHEYDSVGSDERMPPPVARQKPVPDMASSLGMSSLGSCHSWLPEQFGSAASFFGSQKGQGGVSPVGSMDMEYSAGGAEYSHGGSVGGGSLTRVFETDNVSQGEHNETMASPNMNQQGLNQVPSWERSLLSRSPLSIASDDESLISKSSSSKVSDRVLSPTNFPREERGSGNDDMMCE